MPKLQPDQGPCGASTQTYLRASSSFEGREAKVDPPPWKEILHDGGDTSKVTVAMGDTHQSRDIPKGLQPV